jgi:hypothetical protein
MSDSDTKFDGDANSNFRMTRSRAKPNNSNQATTSSKSKLNDPTTKKTPTSHNLSSSSSTYGDNNNSNTSSKFNKKFNDTEQKIKDKIKQMQPILSNYQLKNLDEHKYSSGGSTLLDPYFQPFWRWLVEQMPLWLAPNTITVIGLIINVITSTILIFYSPNATDHVIYIYYFFCLICLLNF